MTNTAAEASIRVLFDGNWWSNGPISNRSVQRSFIFAWSERFPGDDLVVAVPTHCVREAQRELAGRATVVSSKLSPQGISAIIEMPFLARRVAADVTITHNFAPLFGRSAVFIHDFLFLSNPEWFTAKERLYFNLMRRTVPCADLVFASTRSEARRIAHYSPQTIAPIAVGMGLSPSLQGEASPVEGLDTNQFVLTVGRLNARKNLVTTARAALRSGEITSDRPLVIVGEASGKAAELGEDIQEAVRSGAVRFLGRAEDGQLRWLYANTALFVFLTLDEGFGMPTLEALFSGAPLLVSDIAVFREILGSNASFTDPLDVVSAAKAIKESLASPPPAPTRDTVLSGFTWTRSVELMRTAVEDLVADDKRP